MSEIKQDLAQEFLDRMVAARREAESRFVDEYMLDLNGTQAVLRSFPEMNVQTASRKAWALLQKRDIRDEIDRRCAERRASNRMTVAGIENMLRDLAEVEPLDIWDEQGNIRPLQDIPPHARRAIKSIKRKSKENYITGEEEITLEIELWDKKGAIELLGKYKKMFTDKVELSGRLEGKISFSINGVVK
jgi:phage terminase small subunit